MEPTIAIDVEERHTVAQKEVFAPVPAVRAFEGEDDALRLANSTDYDLAGGRLASDLSRASRATRNADWCGQLNTYGGPDITVQLGGKNQSGNGHGKSMHALDNFSDLKTEWIKVWGK